MLRTVIGALVGREIDRRDGDSGIKGVLLGAAAPRILSRLGPLASSSAALTSPKKPMIDGRAAASPKVPTATA